MLAEVRQTNYQTDLRLCELSLLQYYSFWYKSYFDLPNTVYSSLPHSEES